MADLARIKQLAADGKLDDLRALAITQGLTPHPRMKAETIAKMILEHIAHPKQDLKHVAEKPAREFKINTENEIREACKGYFAKEGFVATFNPDNTWHFVYRGCEDSGHMSASLRVIRMKAEMVSHGRRQLMAAAEDFGSLPGANTPKNRYTNVVLNA